VAIVFITAFDMRNEDLPAFMNKEDVIKKPFLGRHLSKHLVQILRAKANSSKLATA
jgi:two-component SAPR family response regulator